MSAALPATFAPSLTLATVDVPIDAIDMAPWNTNEMPPHIFAAERASIIAYGFLDPCLVRPYPDVHVDRLQMIDGEHRIKVLRELRAQGIPAGAHADLESLISRWVAPSIVRPMSDVFAQRLLLILQETRGKGNPVKVGQLLATLAGRMRLEDLRQGLPYGEEELRGRLQLAGFSFGAMQLPADPLDVSTAGFFSGGAAAPGGAPGGEAPKKAKREMHVTITCPQCGHKFDDR